jgi:hypothetical protein
VVSGENCTGLHPYGDCAPGEGCNRERCGVFELGGPCDGERVDGFAMCRYHLRRRISALEHYVVKAARRLGVDDPATIDTDARLERVGEATLAAAERLTDLSAGDAS